MLRPVARTVEDLWPNRVIRRGSFVAAVIAVHLAVAGCTTTIDQSSPTPASTQTGAPSPAAGQVDRMISLALEQVGDQYVFGADVEESDPDPEVWDQGELTQWSAYQIGSHIPGSSFEQYLDLKVRGLLIPVEAGMNTPGALLFSFSEEPTAGGGRPAQAHVALSLGDARTVEAQSPETGVVVADAAGRFGYAALLPNVTYS